jgi:hypothetical protein
MKNKIQLMLVILSIIVISFPSIGFSKSKDVMSEYCDVYSGDIKNKKELDEFKKTVIIKAKENGLKKIVKESQFSNTTADCIKNVINKVFEKVVVLKHTSQPEEKGRKICDKVKITYNPEAINKYLSQESCLKDWSAGKEYSDWCKEIDKVLTEKNEKYNVGLIIETQIPDIDANKKEVIEKEEEKQFFEMVEANKAKYNVVDKSSFMKAAEENKIPIYGITDNDILQMGKLLNLDVIVHRLINKNSRVTKVRKINTGKVVLFNTYETKTDISETDSSKTDSPKDDSSEWVKYGKDHNGTIHFYKKGTVDKDNDIVKVFNKWVFAKKEISSAIQYRRENSMPTKRYDKLSHMIYLSEIDCPGQSERMMYLFLYDKDGKSLYSHTFSDPEWILINPETNGETLLKEVCK